MAELRISQASQDALKARLATPEGKEALKKLAQPDCRDGVRGDAAGLAGVAGDGGGDGRIPGSLAGHRRRIPVSPWEQAGCDHGKRKGARRTAKRRRIPAK